MKRRLAELKPGTANRVAFWADAELSDRLAKSVAMFTAATPTGLEVTVSGVVRALMLCGLDNHPVMKGNGDDCT